MKRKFTHFGLIVFLFMGLTFGAFAQGDDCANAVAVSAGNHTADGPSSGGGAANICFTGATNADWYSYTPAADGTIDIESTTTGNDTRLSFYDGTCGSLNCVDSDDDGGGGYLSLLENLTVVTGTTYYIEWDDRWEVTGFDWTLTFTPAPTCLDPTAQTETSITTTTVSLGWTENGGATTWEIEWGVTGFTQGSGTMLTGITVNPHPLTGLSTATTYDWYVRSDCGGGDYSAWTGPSTFTTACDAFTATFAENYDGVTAPAIPDCWSSIVDATTSYATVVTYTASTPNSAPNHVRLYNSDDVSAILLLITPELSDLTTQANQIRFYAKSGSTSTDMIIGTMSDPADDATFTSFSTISLTNTYTEYTIPFGPTYTATDEYIAFKHGLGGTYRYIYIDDFNYEPIPSCPAPTLQTEINFTTSGADLGWTDAAGTWDVYVVSSGSAAPGQTTPPTANNITTKPYTYSLGSANQTYDWYVRRDCDGDNIGTSSWTGPSTFTTACASVSVPWNEGFEGMASVGSGIIPNCMAEDGDWSTGDAPQSYGRDARTGTNYAYTNYSADDWLFSVGIDLTAGTSYDFSFWYVTDGNSGWTTLEAQYGTGQTSGDMTTAIGTPVSAPTNTTYVEYRGSFTPATTGTYYMGIHVVASSSPWYITFDDLLVEETPSCPAPTAQTETAITSTTASLGWTEAGTANTWDIELGVTGFTPTGTPTQNDVAANPYTYSGLTLNTSYDWYVRADCGGSTSSWTGPSTFTTMPGAHSFPLTEDFESGFTYFDNASGNDVDFADETTLQHGGTHSVHNAYGSNNTNILHETGILDLSSTSAALLEFWHIAKTEGLFDKCYIEISTDGGGSYTALPLASYQGSGTGYGTAGYFDEDDYTEWGTGTETPDNSWWKKEEFDLSAYNTTNVRFRFRLTSDGSSNRDGWYIDDIHIYEPSCPAPTTQTADAGPVSAELDWTESGSATIWDIEYGDDGFTQGAGTTVIGAAKPYDMTGLTESSDYDWYVRSDCGAGSTSTWTGPHSFSTTDGVAVNPTPADGASGIAVTAKTFDWDDVTGATSYTINIGTATTLTDIVLDGACPASTYTYTGADWDYSEDYFWTVTTVYSGGTAASNEWDFFTECAAITTFPYTESFESGVPANCWTEEIVNDVGTDPDWTQETATLHPTGGNPVDGSNIARFNSYSCPDNSTARIVTPLLDFAGLTGMAMSFWMYHDDSYTTTPLEGVIVQISTDGATWTDVTELIERYSSAGDAWAKHTVDLSAYDGQTVHLAILGQSDYGNDSYIDMLTIHNDAPATAMWSGATDNNWSDVTNWSTTDIPYSTTDVTIPTGGLTNYPTIVAAAECDNLTIESAVGGDASILGDENLTVNGNATVQRFVTGGVWHDVSASTQGQTLQSIYFGGSPNVWLAHYNEPDNTRTFLSTLTDPMDPGAGFEIWVETGNNVVIDYTGTLQTSDLTLSTGSSTPLSWTGAEPLGYNLIGNPFASPIDLNQGTWALTDVSTSFWVWDPVAGSYQDWNTSGSTGTLTNGIVPMGQGFFIQATNTAPSITIPMASRVHSGQAFYKDGRDNEQMTFSMQAAYGEYTDGMNIAFLEGATDEFDTYDTRKMFAGEGSAPQIYTVQGEEDLGINGLPMLTEKETIVSLSYRVGENGEQTLIADLSGLLDTEVVLEDVKLDAFQSLNSNPVYVFESVTYGNPDRFLLHFTRTVTAIDTKNEDAPKVYSYDGAIYIKSSGKLAETDKVVFVYDMFGRTVLQTKVSASTLVRIPMYVSDAYFVVKTIADGKVYTSKVFVKQ